MGITHSWDGTVLTITSDSGTSSADLKGEKGDTGIRGAQGVKGKTGCINPELLNEYATQEYVKVKVAEAQVAGSPVDMSAYYTKSETEEKIAALSNALTGTASGTNGIAMKDISPLPQKLKLNVSRVNLMPSPFAELDFLENGKNYTFSVKLKDEAELPSGYYYILQGETADGNTIDVLSLWVENIEGVHSFTVGEEYTTFRILYDDRLTADMFEYCQLEEGIVATAPTEYIEDMNSVSYFAYGKNIFNYSYSNWYKYIINGSTRYVMDLYIPCDCVVSMGRREESGTFYIRKYKGSFDNGGTNVNANGYAFAATGKEPMKQAIKKEAGYLYRLETTKQSWESDYVSWVQIECGAKNSDYTEYEPYKEPVEILDINNVSTIYPATTIISDTEGVNISTEYNKDLNKIIANLTAAVISLGGNV